MVRRIKINFFVFLLILGVYMFSHLHSKKGFYSLILIFIYLYIYDLVHNLILY